MAWRGVAAVSATGARGVLHPQGRHAAVAVKLDDLEILEVHPDRVVLSATPDTVVPGRYGLWLDGGAGHARIGAILQRDETTVTRVLESVEAGTLRPGPARFNQYYVAGDPTTAWGCPRGRRSSPSEVGDLPCWLVPPAEPATTAG